MKRPMSDITLMQYISKKLHTPVHRHSLSDGEPYSYCGVLSFTDEFIHRKDFLEFLINGTDSKIPSLKSVHEEYVYAVIRTEDSVYFAGPVTFMAPIYLKDNYRHPLSDRQKAQHIPQVDFRSYLDDILFWHAMLTDTPASQEDIIHTSCMNPNQEEKIFQNFSNLLFNNNENVIHHNPYDQELREFGSIEHGDLDQLRQSMQEDYDGEIGTLAKEPLRNLKNLAIVLITLASRAAIRGGLSPEISFSLSDTYIQQIEDCNDIALVTPLAHKAEFQYAQMVHDLNEQKRGILSHQKNPRILKCKDYIFSHLHDRITMEDLAREADCNQNYLSQLFKQCEGISISQYILNEKINRAKNLLIYSDYSYIEIATYLGFSSQSHLGQRFKKLTGYTLKQYRETYGRIS